MRTGAAVARRAWCVRWLTAARSGPGHPAAGAAAGPGGDDAAQQGAPSPCCAAESSERCPPLLFPTRGELIASFAQAYLHHYARHGVGPEVFDEQMAVLEQVLFDYNSL